MQGSPEIIFEQKKKKYFKHTLTLAEHIFFACDWLKMFLKTNISKKNYVQ